MAKLIRVRLKNECVCSSCKQPMRKGEIVYQYNSLGRKVHLLCENYQSRMERKWKARLNAAQREGVY